MLTFLFLNALIPFKLEMRQEKLCFKMVTFFSVFLRGGKGETRVLTQAYWDSRTLAMKEGRSGRISEHGLLVYVFSCILAMCDFGPL